MFSWIHLSVIGLTLVSPAIAADECQPSTWQARLMETGGINCRFSTKTGSKVSSDTCATIAKKYEITLDTFYELNPRLKSDCKNVLPDIRYCVEGFPEPIRAYNGLCGPPHSNATCVGTDKQCCNKNTWTCGDTKSHLSGKTKINSGQSKSLFQNKDAMVCMINYLLYSWSFKSSTGMH
ncbi:hypothetical protein FGSG_00029 [Fusarium graminearum PH-1]|uniref:Chromosome 1, complete genome n=1 Tax=Gibberella zeae (strain ATCC MYA-4620 / CBS 123657 / FGSC 9075 / NRRL 31084 / PH-1) TaxID=229533 RepID=I1R9A0_GIBZE|nr:hypothetical protein FGSG_00029 [Fusarium graminearum PH-1]ESU05129.1 hypothetical protein FGSG_00029 [Fusarium graminearum PH-1]CAF3497348.1 unnamed protein product [Fusarium graminearum]CEF71854.1 unnamed protein product [Fusarium graminearum]|eukprot:XP_011315614.1 hypothetical protein FGSG_00029 [Fusarium graminearum PH-1]